MTTFSIEVGSDVVLSVDRETGEQITARIWFVAARREDSVRFWPDYVHARAFDLEEDARVLSRRIREAWGAAPTSERFTWNQNWRRVEAPDPMVSLRPFGEEWEREQCDRFEL